VKRPPATAFIGFAAASPASMALADDGDHHRGQGYRISQYGAMDIAYSFDLAWFKGVKRGNGNGEIERCAGDGQEIEIDISGRSGEIIKFEYEDDDKC